MESEKNLKSKTAERYFDLTTATFYTNWLWIGGFMRDSEYNRIIDSINREVINIRLILGDEENDLKDQYDLNRYTVSKDNRTKFLYNQMLGYLCELISDKEELKRCLLNLGFSEDEIGYELDWLEFEN